jgi:hypothetical protein
MHVSIAYSSSYFTAVLYIPASEPLSGPLRTNCSSLALATCLYDEHRGSCNICHSNKSPLKDIQEWVVIHFRGANAGVAAFEGRHWAILAMQVCAVSIRCSHLEDIFKISRPYIICGIVTDQ